MVNVGCFYFGIGGWARHAQGFLAALSRFTEIALISWNDPSPGEETSPDAARMLHNARASLDRNIGLEIGPMERMGRLPGAINIGFTTWETSRIPAEKLRYLRTLDDVWIPSRWGREVLLHHGLEPRRVAVIPEGVDTCRFAPAPVVTTSDSEPFRFLCVGKWEERKGVKDLVRAFAETFEPDEAVELWLQCANPYLPDFDLERAVEALDLPRHAPIVCGDVLAGDALVDLYHRCHAFVLPTRGEGWGLPIVEAMACGLPVIVTDHSGHTDFATANTAYLIRVAAMFPVADPVFFDPSVDHGLWAQPDVGHLKELIRYVFENREEARCKGTTARHSVAAHWTWEQAASKAWSRMRTTAARAGLDGR